MSPKHFFEPVYPQSRSEYSKKMFGGEYPVNIVHAISTLGIEATFGMPVVRDTLASLGNPVPQGSIVLELGTLEEAGVLARVRDEKRPTAHYYQRTGYLNPLFNLADEIYEAFPNQPVGPE